MKREEKTGEEPLQEIKKLQEENEKLKSELSEYKQLEERHPCSSKMLEALISISPDGVGMISLDGKIRLASDKLMEVYGYSPEDRKDIIGRSAFELIDESSHKQLIENINRFLAGELGNNITEYLAIKKDKSRFYIDVNSAFIYDGGGKPIGIVFVERDITERKNTEKEIKQKNIELAELNATKDKFFSIIAHDLKSPFQGLMGYAEILASEYSVLSEEEKLDFISNMSELTKSTYKLLENLLDWARIQTGQMELHPESFHLYDELPQTLLLAKQTARNKKIEFICRVDQSVCVKADRNMLSTVIRNLISNSIKFTYPGGKITLSAERIDDFVKISVSDTGIGIEKEDIKRLFQLDNHLHNAGTSNEKGSGLGLMLCKEMIEKLGGTITVVSQPGKGSIFSFTIPSGKL